MSKLVSSKTAIILCLCIIVSMFAIGCMGGKTEPTPVPTVAATSTTETTTSTTETTTSTTEATTTEGTTPAIKIADVMAKAEEHGDTPEVKYGNAIFLAYMLTARELTVAGTDMQKTPGDLTKVKEICDVTDKNFEEIKTSVDGLTVPKGYEPVKEGFMSFLGKTQESMKALGAAKDEKEAKEIEGKLVEATKLGQEVLTALEKAGYKPTEDFQKYVQETFMGGSGETVTTEGTEGETTEGETTEGETTEGETTEGETTESGK